MAREPRIDIRVSTTRNLGEAELVVRIGREVVALSSVSAETATEAAISLLATAIATVAKEEDRHG